MTLSNCDHSASTDENSLPTYIHFSLVQHGKLQPASQLVGGGTYSNDRLERTVQLVDVGQHMLKALIITTCDMSASHLCIIGIWWGRGVLVLTMAISPINSCRCCSK